MQQDVLLVGSIPLDTAEQVFRDFGHPLGGALRTMPDGEVGPRKHWISRIHYQVLAGHPELETVRYPAPENGVERRNPRNAGDSYLFKVKEGVQRVRFGDVGWRIGYARDAINSYFVFKTLREKGELPKHLRFQVSLASVESALPPRIFPTPADIAKVRPGFTEALAAEVDTIVKHIPNDDLAIQWDCATEVQDCYGAMPGQPAEGRDRAQHRAVPHAQSRHPRDRASLAITFASARSAAGRAFRPPTCLQPSIWPTLPSRRRAAASIGFTFRCCRMSKSRSSHR